MPKVADLEKELKNVDKELQMVEAELAKLKTHQRKLNEKRNSIKNSINKLKSANLASIDWSAIKTTWSDEIERIRKDVFHIDKFRPKQLSAINSTLSKQNSIVVMPTGAGKSLCYQLPALVEPGLTIVVSPLISLMEDQVRSLMKKNIKAKHMTSTSPKEETNAALNILKEKNSDIKLLYVTPERFAKSKRFMANLQKCYAEGRLQRIAIDEVHCCSQWGHDFRPDYKFLGILANMFPKTPILGLTATATGRVLEDVQRILNIPGCLIIKSTFNRPNLFYTMLEKPTSQDECLTILEKLLKYRYKNETGIIYTNTIKDAEDISQGLRKRGLKVGCYHATMDSDARTKVHLKWHDKHYQVIIATVAFGMGIDKPDVRFVIHHTISKSMENYYQESGRAGRDGLRAECVTMYRMQDLFKVSPMVFSSNGHLDYLYGMLKYCLNGTYCRRQLIAEYFDEDWGESDCNKMCDICCQTINNQKEIAIENYIKVLYGIIDNAANLDTKLTAQKLLDAWYLKGPVNLRHKGKEPNYPRSIGEDIIAFLITEHFLEEAFHFTAYSTISYLKKGVNMGLLEDPDFSVKIKLRRYSLIELESPAPTELTKGSGSTERVFKRKSDKDTELKPKRSKVLVISDESD